MLCDFESEVELDQLQWRCNTLFSLSQMHSTHGTQSLKFEFFPSDFPGFASIITQRDWREYSALIFDVFNPNDENVKIQIRIDDREDNPDHSDRYNQTIMLKPEENRVVIPVETLVTSGTGRILALEKIAKVIIFMKNPTKTLVLFFDYIRLC